MGDLITFAPNTGVNPTFAGRGSVIQNPDILPIFWGPYWPGIGDLTVSSVMQALNMIVSGPYLHGLVQYGYSGSASVRPPRVDRSSNNITLPILAPNVRQAISIDNAVQGYIKNLLSNDEIDNVDDNHDLIVFVLIDPSVPGPQSMDAFGKVSSVSGDNTEINVFEFLDDNTRFEGCWVSTSSNQLIAVMQTLTHELVESISDPFNNGWHQVTPVPTANAGQIGDVCNQNGLVNGVGVVAYWSNADGACILPTPGIRRVGLSSILTKHEPHDEPLRQGFVNLGLLCGSGFFDYFERTFFNALTIHAQIDGYESPLVDWTIAGQPVSILGGGVDVDATWDPEPPATAGAPPIKKPGTAHLSTLRTSNQASEITVTVGPLAGNASVRIEVQVRESFDVTSAGGNGSTTRSAILDLDLVNQEIVWGREFIDAKKNCARVQHLFDGPERVLGPPRPGDPASLVNLISNELREQAAQRSAGLRSLAEILKDSRPELSAALMAVSDRTR